MAVGQARRRLRDVHVERAVTCVLVAGSVLFVLAQLHPRLLLTDTTANGGDMGAHVWGPAFLRDHLLPEGRLWGWAPDWYAGFPAYHFYMVVPALAVVGLDLLPGVPYNVAFKLVTASGVVLMPAAAWGAGRLARQPWPVPGALAVGTLPFVFERSFSIYGGNALSTLAGEFSFAISLCFALLFVGLAAGGLDTPRRRVGAAVVLALCVTCHPIPSVFALLGGAASLVAARLVSRAPRGRDEAVPAADEAADPDPASAASHQGDDGEGPVPRTGLEEGEPADDGATAGRWSSWRPVAVAAGSLAAVVVVGGLLTSFWTLPFVARRAYLNDMGWERLTTYLEPLFPGPIGRRLSSALGGGAHAGVPGDATWVVVLAAIGAGASIAFRRRLGTTLAVTAGLVALAFRVAPQGRLWNARLLPFWHLALVLLAALAVVEVVRAAAILLRPEGDDRRLVGGGLVALGLAVTVALAFPLRSLPLGTTSADGRYHWLWLSTTDQSPVRSWARWNYTGYERKPAWPEYRDVVETMAAVGADRGCGRAMWEYEPELDRFGTPMALMLLPYWTDGCMGSMEGLYFEASATTPYHFLNQSELSERPSRPQRDLPYGPLDVARGIEHLRQLGVRYYLATSAAAVAQAGTVPGLAEVAVSGRFHVFEVAGSELVVPLASEPVVADPSPSTARAWQDMAVDWYLDRDRPDVALAGDGPAGWARVDAAGGDGLPVTPQPAVTVSGIEQDTDAISFRVNRTGVPVLVRASYFPTWHAVGADGPYRVAPNLMVVVPTSRAVRLVHRAGAVDHAALALTGAGALGLAALGGAGRALRRRGAVAGPRPAAG